MPIHQTTNKQPTLMKKLLQADDLILLNLFGKLDLGTKKMSRITPKQF
jgi:hypothetical protein